VLVLEIVHGAPKDDYAYEYRCAEYEDEKIATA